MKEVESIKHEYSISMKLHENEVSLRLEFEHKLSNITAM